MPDYLPQPEGQELLLTLRRIEARLGDIPHISVYQDNDKELLAALRRIEALLEKIALSMGISPH